MIKKSQVLIEELKDLNQVQHDAILLKQAQTNGKVRTHEKLLWASFSFTATVLGFFMYHLATI